MHTRFLMKKTFREDISNNNNNINNNNNNNNNNDNRTLFNDGNIIYWLPSSLEYILPSQELYIIIRMKSAHVMVCRPVRLVHLYRKKDNSRSSTSLSFNVDDESEIK